MQANVFITIPQYFRPYGKYDALISWFSWSESCVEAFGRFVESGAREDGEQVIASLPLLPLIDMDYSVSYCLLSEEDVSRWSRQMPRFIALLKRHCLTNKLTEKLLAEIPLKEETQPHALWHLAAMLDALGDYETAMRAFRLGRAHCDQYEPDKDAIIYDWLAAAVAYWHYRRFDDAIRCLRHARLIVDPSTYEELEELETRIAILICANASCEE